MIDVGLLNRAALARIYLVANTPGYLVKHFRNDESVAALSHAYPAHELIASILEIDARQLRTIEDIATAYAILVALLVFHNDSTVGWQLGTIKNLAWLDGIIDIFGSSIAATVDGRVRAPTGALKTARADVSLTVSASVRVHQ